MKKLLFFAILPLVNFAQIPSGYYDGTDGLVGYPLKTKINEIISKQIYSHTYDDLKTLYGQTDLDKYYENDNTILDIYSEKPNGVDAYTYNLTNIISSATAEGQGWNREHGMPQSTFYGIYPMYSDLHFVIPADARINQLRSNFPYARNNGAANDCNSPNTTPCTATNGSKLGKSTTPGYTNTVYEPIDEFKGDVARFLLYFVTRYERSLNNFDFMLSTSPLDGNKERGYENWYINMLKDWNTLDPVSQRERDRNEIIYSIQKIRNPFIDHPEWVDLIWSNSSDNIAPQAPSQLKTDAVGESFVTLSWDPSLDSDVLGYGVYVNGVFYKTTNSTFTTVDRLLSSSSSNFTVKAYDYSYNFSLDSNMVNVNTLSSDNLTKDLMITKYIEGSGNNKAIEVTNLTNHEVDLENYYIRTQLKGSSSYYFSDSYELEGKLSAGESIVVIHPNASFSSFDTNLAKFITNSPALSFTGSQYVELAFGKKYLSNANTNNYEMAYESVDAVGLQNTNNNIGNVSLYRNTDVKDPNVNYTISEWTSYPSNYSSGLGNYLEVSTPDMPIFDIEIYPNPASNYIFVKGNNVSDVRKAQIFDFSGNLIKEINNPFITEKNLNISNLNIGIYILKLDTKSFNFIKK